MLVEEFFIAFVHAIERFPSRLIPVELSRVHVPDLDDSHRRQSTVELVVTHQLLQPFLGVFQGFPLEERGEVVVQLRVRWIVMALVAEALLLGQHHPQRHHGKEQPQTRRRLFLGGECSILKDVLGNEVRRAVVGRRAGRHETMTNEMTTTTKDVERRARRRGHHPVGSDDYSSPPRNARVYDAYMMIGCREGCHRCERPCEGGHRLMMDGVYAVVCTVPRDG